MKYEEAIERIKVHFEIHDDGRLTPYLDEAVLMAIEAMEKQISKKVVFYNNCGNKSASARCPNCYGIISSPHCGYCGQKIEGVIINERCRNHKGVEIL